MSVFNIQQPPDGKLLKWSPGFGAEATQSFDRKQAFIDSEVIRLMGPMTPRRSGALIRASSIGTAIGTGKIIQSTPYARRQYYEHKTKSQWFERMKNRHKDQILEGARRL